MLSLNLFTELCSHRCGYEKIIDGASAQAHIDHNRACSCRGEHRHKRKIMSTAKMKSLISFSGALRLLHHYGNNLAHLLAFKNLVIEF